MPGHEYTYCHCGSVTTGLNYYIKSGVISSNCAGIANQIATPLFLPPFSNVSGPSNTTNTPFSQLICIVESVSTSVGANITTTAGFNVLLFTTSNHILRTTGVPNSTTVTTIPQQTSNGTSALAGRLARSMLQLIGLTLAMAVRCS